MQPKFLEILEKNNGSQVPYNTPRAAEIWETTRKAAGVLGLRGYAGIDFVVDDLARVVDVNARPTTSIIGIAKVMREEIGESILRARFDGLSDRVTLEGEFIFQKIDLTDQIIGSEPSHNWRNCLD